MAQTDGTPGVQKLSVKHEDIMNHMLMNPTHQLGDVARHFGMTQPWLSCIIHSEAFQARLAERKETIFHSTVLPIKEKLAAIAHQSLDQIAERMPLMEPREVISVADSTLDRLGYGTKPTGLPPGTSGQAGTVTVNVNLRAELEEARRMIGARPALQPALEVIVDGQPAPLGIGRSQEVQAADIPEHGDTHTAIPVAPDPGARTEVPQGAEV